MSDSDSPFAPPEDLGKPWYLTPNEAALLTNYRKLPKVTRDRLDHVMETLSGLPAYKEPPPPGPDRVAASAALAAVRAQRTRKLGLAIDPGTPSPRYGTPIDD